MRRAVALLGELGGDRLVGVPRGKERQNLLFHGGGYVSGSPVTHRKLGANIGLAAGIEVFLPVYRLAPEHPFPAGVGDALAAYDWLLERGYSEDRIAIGGDSAGGGLALSLLLMLRERGRRLPGLVILLSPWTDLTASSPSYEQFATIDPSITRQALIDCAGQYASGRDHRDAALSSLFANLGGLPPMLIHAGGDEIMQDDGRILGERAEAAGVDVQFKLWPGLWHVFQHAAPEVPEAKQAIDEVAAFIRSHFDVQVEVRRRRGPAA